MCTQEGSGYTGRQYSTQEDGAVSRMAVRTQDGSGYSVVWGIAGPPYQGSWRTAHVLLGSASQVGRRKGASKRCSPGTRSPSVKPVRETWHAIIPSQVVTVPVSILDWDGAQ